MLSRIDTKLLALLVWGNARIKLHHLPILFEGICILQVAFEINNACVVFIFVGDIQNTKERGSLIR